jgi:hypothetical protein
MAKPRNHAIEYGNFGKKKPPPDHFVTGSPQKANRMQKKPKRPVPQ